jgi:hypothetical protein
MDRAATIVERGGVHVERYGWSVASECTAGKAYTVTADGACSCPDFARRGGPCKHGRNHRAGSGPVSRERREAPGKQSPGLGS